MKLGVVHFEFAKYPTYGNRIVVGSVIYICHGDNVGGRVDAVPSEVLVKVRLIKILPQKSHASIPLKLRRDKIKSKNKFTHIPTRAVLPDVVGVYVSN